MYKNITKLFMFLIILSFSLNAHAAYLGVANADKIIPDFSEFDGSGTAYHYGSGITAGGKAVYSVGSLDGSWNVSGLYVKAYNQDGSAAWTYDVSPRIGGRATNYNTSQIQTLSNGNIIVAWDGTSGGCGSDYQMLILNENGGLVKDVTNISETSSSYNCYGGSLELSNGNVLYYWQSAGDEYHMKIFDSSGNVVKSATSISNTGSRDGSCTSMYSHSVGSIDGKFMFGYNCYEVDNYYGVIYNNDGTQISVGGYNHFKISSVDKGGSPQIYIQGLSNDKFVTLFMGEPGADYTSRDERRAFISGTGAVTGETILRVIGNSSIRQLISLKDGGFVLAGVDGSSYLTAELFDNNATSLEGPVRAGETADSYGRFNPGPVSGFIYVNYDDASTYVYGVSASVSKPVITQGDSVNVSMSEDGSPTAFSLTLNATDPGGETLTWSISSAASHGTASASGTGASKSISYTPTANYFGSDSFKVKVTNTSGGTDEITVNVTITSVPDAVTITSNGGGSLASVNVNENTTAVTTVTVAPVSGETHTFSIDGGTDGAYFSVNSSTGVLTFISAPDYENPSDSGADNSYEVIVKASNGTNSDSQMITVNVKDLDDTPPAFTSAASVSVAENTTEVVTVTVTDPDSPSASFSITGGSDSAKFSINSSTGELVFINAPDYENPGDADTNNVYIVQVSASDGTNAANQVITVTVTNQLNENAPAFTGGTSFTVPENQTSVGTASATDADGDTLAFSITGGADAAKFSIGAATGIISFITAPDYENPTDAGGDNNYSVTVTVSDGTYTASTTFTVTVSNLNDNLPVFSSSGTFSVDEGATAVGTLAATDADGDTLSYSLSGGADSGKFILNSFTGVLVFASAQDYENPLDANADNVYELIVTVNDGPHSVPMNVTVSVNNINDNAPVFTSSAAVNSPENQTSVMTVTADDADGNTLIFTITGGADSAKFSLNSANGALAFVSAPDYETPADADGNNVYLVTVKAYDGVHQVTQNIAVTVTDVFEPVFEITSPAAASVPEKQTAVMTVTADDPLNRSIVYSIIGGADASSFSINASTGVLVFNSAPDYENPSDADSNNTYIVRVKAAAVLGTDNDEQNITVTVTNVNEAPVAEDSTLTVQENTAAAGTIDADDEDGDSLNYTISAQPGHGTVSINAATGAFTYIPASGYIGADSFKVRVSDGTLSDEATVSVTVTLSSDKTRDSDGDGIPDYLEGTRDSDGDGIPDYLDEDANGDGKKDYPFTVTSQGTVLNYTTIQLKTGKALSFSIPSSVNPSVTVTKERGTAVYEVVRNGSSFELKITAEGAFAGKYTVKVTDYLTGEVSVFTLHVPMNIFVQEQQIYEKDSTKKVILKGGEISSAASFSVLDESGAEDTAGRIATVTPGTFASAASGGNTAYGTIMPANAEEFVNFSILAASDEESALTGSILMVPAVVYSGTLRDSSQNPVSGVSIFAEHEVKYDGVSYTASSGADGRFSMEIPSRFGTAHTLTFSKAGYVFTKISGSTLTGYGQNVTLQATTKSLTAGISGLLPGDASSVVLWVKKDGVQRKHASVALTAGAGGTAEHTFWLESDSEFSYITCESAGYLTGTKSIGASDTAVSIPMTPKVNTDIKASAAKADNQAVITFTGRSFSGLSLIVKSDNGTLIGTESMLGTSYAYQYSGSRNITLSVSDRGRVLYTYTYLADNRANDNNVKAVYLNEEINIGGGSQVANEVGDAEDGDGMTADEKILVIIPPAGLKADKIMEDTMSICGNTDSLTANLEVQQLYSGEDALSGSYASLYDVSLYVYGCEDLKFETKGENNILERIEITVPFNTSVVKPGDIESGEYRIFSAESYEDFAAGKLSAVPMANIIEVDYITGTATFWVDHLTSFGIVNKESLSEGGNSSGGGRSHGGCSAGAGDPAMSLMFLAAALVLFMRRRKA